ncbi:hypothetical protein CF328_g8783, partial [Tilletia controversa]
MSNGDESTTLPARHSSTDSFREAFATNLAPTTPISTDILLQEIRSVSSQLSARMDGLNMRLGGMERNARFQDDQPGSPSPAPRSALRQPEVATNPNSSAQARSSPEYDPPPPSVTLGRGMNHIRPGAPIPPHLTEASTTNPVMVRTAAALGTPVSAPSRTTSLPSNSSPPLERYNQLTRGEKRHIQRSIASLGLTFREFMHAFRDDEDDDTGSDHDDEQQPITDPSPTIPLPSTNSGDTSTTIQASSRPVEASTLSAPPPSSTPTPSPRPETSNTSSALVVSTRPMICRTEWIGEYGGEPNELENFLTRIRDLIRSETQEELIPTWIKAVLRTLPRTFTQNAAVWHQGLSDQEAMRLTSFDAWAAAMRSAFPVNRSQLRRDARSRRWKTTEETSIAYFFDKVRLLRQAFGQDQEDDTLVTDIKDGLPETIIGLLRLPRVGATLAELRFELGDWEPNWRVQFKVPLRTSKSDDSMTINSPAATTSAASSSLPFWNTTAPRAPATTRLLQTTMGRSASAPSTPAATGTQTPASSSLRAPP